MKRILLLTIAALILLSCTKKDTGIKTYYNNSTPANPNFNIEIVESFELNNEGSEKILDTPFDVAVDKENNIYILSAGNNKIVKYAKDGSYITSFAGSGNGPGEFTEPGSIFYMDDTLYVTDHSTKKILKYDKSGRFINSILSPIFGRSNSFYSSKNIFISQNIDISDTDIGIAVKSKLTLLDKTLKPIKDIENLPDQSNSWMGLTRIPYAVSDKFIFTANNCTDKYQINYFDHKGNKKGTINKNYAKVPREHLKERLFELTGSKYKRAIANLFADYKNNLWVVKAQLDSLVDKENHLKFIVDVFIDGVYQNTVDLGIGDQYCQFNYEVFSKVIGDRIYSMFIGEDKVIVSKYVIKEN